MENPILYGPLSQSWNREEFGYRNIMEYSKEISTQHVVFRVFFPYCMHLGGHGMNQQFSVFLQVLEMATPRPDTPASESQDFCSSHWRCARSVFPCKNTDMACPQRPSSHVIHGLSTIHVIYIMNTYGGFLSHGATPSSHPFRLGVSIIKYDKPSSYWGTPPILGNLHPASKNGK